MARLPAAWRSGRPAAVSTPIVAEFDVKDQRIVAERIVQSAAGTAALNAVQIAERLVISEATAIRHVANIYAKLGVHRRGEAVRIAMERGLIETTPSGRSATPST